MPYNHPGNAQPAIDKEEHTHPFGENAFGSKQVIEPIPSAFLSQKRLDYSGRGDSNPVYVGFNVLGALTSTTNWVIQKLTYDISNRVTLVQVATDSWDNRVTATYS